LGLNEFVVGHPVDQLQTTTARTKTGIIEIALDPGSFVGLRGFHALQVTLGPTLLGLTISH